MEENEERKKTTDETTNLAKDASEKHSLADHFWNRLETASDVRIPLYVKNILRFNNYDNAMAFRRITVDTIKEMEDFARETMKLFLEPDDDRQSFYGNFHRCPEKFRWMSGDKHLIEELVKFVRDQQPGFWQRPSVSHKIEDDSKKRESTPSTTKRIKV